MSFCPKKANCWRQILWWGVGRRRIQLIDTGTGRVLLEGRQFNMHSIGNENIYDVVLK
jgi:hypothetical protein